MEKVRCTAGVRCGPDKGDGFDYTGGLTEVLDTSYRPLDMMTFLRGRLPRLLFMMVSCASILLNVNAHERSNILLICIDDLRPELGCYGVDYVVSPNIDRIASEGRIFSKHYVQAPTCGASRYALLTGQVGGPSNAALFDRAEKIREEKQTVPSSMPAWFRQHGYTTVSVGKVSHHPGGRGGDRWDDSSELEMPLSWDRHLLAPGPWQDPRGWMHGLANGEIRIDAKTPKGTVEMDVFQSFDGEDHVYPDGSNTDKAIEELNTLAKNDSQPFFLAVGILRPHLPFGAPAKYLKPYLGIELPETPHPSKPEGKTTWHRSGEFLKYDRGGRDPNQDPEFALEVRQHYAACVSFADAQVGRIAEALALAGADKNTIIVLWGDHGWHLGEHAMWGKHTLFEESLRSPLIIKTPDGGKQPVTNAGESTSAIVETLDIFPTLCELAGLPTPVFAQGVSLLPLLKDQNAPGHSAVSYGKSAKTIRTEDYRLIQHKDGHHELYDHRTDGSETKNIADERAAITEQLGKMLQMRLSTRS